MLDIALNKCLQPLFDAFGNALGNLGATIGQAATTSPATGRLLAGRSASGTTFNVGVVQPPVYGHAGFSRRSSNPPVNVSVHDFSGSQVSVQDRKNEQGGIDLQILVEKQMNRAIHGGGLDWAMRTSYGIIRRAM